MTAATASATMRQQIFSSLHSPNYRRYFAGQAVSLVGTWMQIVAGGRSGRRGRRDRRRGTGVCFLLNAASFVAVIVSLARLDVARPRRPPRTLRAPRQIREGLGYVRRTPTLLVPLVMMAIVGCLAYEFQRPGEPVQQQRR